MTEFADLIERLCRISAEEAASPAAPPRWPERIEPDDWCMSPELVSLHGTPAYEALGELERRRLSLFEAVNFFSLNIHGERALVAGIATRLYRDGCDGAARYLHHFLEEENRHMALFAEFCRRYAGNVYPEKRFPVAREYARDEEDFLFFARVLVFEEIVDRYNRRMAADRRLVAIARHINCAHHRDEARHLAFGRRMVAGLFERHRRHWSTGTLERVRAELTAYLAACWREYYNPQAYRDAGLPDPYGTRERLLTDPVRRRHHEAISRPVVRYLLAHGILADAPAP
jgi:hypothetical protein